MRFSPLRSVPMASLLSLAGFALLCSGCAVYPPAPPVYADGSVAYAPPAGAAYAYPYPVVSAPYYTAPYYVGPPVSLGLWFGHSRGPYQHWGHGPYRGGWHGAHGGRWGRRR